MAKDDYFVIVYKVLKYLYDCLKKSQKPNCSALRKEFKIGDEYWLYIVSNLDTDGYVKGVVYAEDTAFIYDTSFMITPKGIEYLETNSVFAKIKGIAADLINSIPNLI
jgi:hypothetical protein